MNNRYESFKSWGILLGGVGLLLVGIGTIFRAYNEFTVSRDFVRHMDTFPKEVVSEIMATNGVDTFSIEDNSGRPWITVENADKTKTQFYMLDEKKEE